MRKCNNKDYVFNEGCHAFNNGECMDEFLCGTEEIPEPEEKTDCDHYTAFDCPHRNCETCADREEKPEAPERHYNEEIKDYCMNTCIFFNQEQSDLLTTKDQQIKRLEEERRWIPVEERLPNQGQIVTAFLPEYGPESYQSWKMPQVSFRDGKFPVEIYGRPSEDVTHWMPLATPPKGTEG